MQMYVLYVYGEKYSQHREENFSIRPWVDSSLSDPPKDAIHLLVWFKHSDKEFYDFVNEGEIFPGTELHLTEERYAEFLLRFV